MKIFSRDWWTVRVKRLGKDLKHGWNKYLRPVVQPLAIAAARKAAAKELEKVNSKGGS